jgi:hypothetical protein
VREKTTKNRIEKEFEIGSTQRVRSCASLVYFLHGRSSGSLERRRSVVGRFSLGGSRVFLSVDRESERDHVVDAVRERDGLIEGKARSEESGLVEEVDQVTNGCETLRDLSFVKKTQFTGFAALSEVVLV